MTILAASPNLFLSSSSCFLDHLAFNRVASSSLGSRTSSFGDVKKNTFLHFNTIHFFENDFLSYFCCIIQINFIYLGVNEPFTSKNRKKKLWIFIDQFLNRFICYWIVELCNEDKIITLQKIYCKFFFLQKYMHSICFAEFFISLFQKLIFGLIFCLFYKSKWFCIL